MHTPACDGKDRMQLLHQHHLSGIHDQLSLPQQQGVLSEAKPFGHAASQDFPFQTSAL
jgi:hypothetical protein